MDKKELLRVIGFSEEFLSKLEQYQENVIELPSRDFSTELAQCAFTDSSTLFVDHLQSHDKDNLTVKTR